MKRLALLSLFLLVACQTPTPTRPFYTLQGNASPYPTVAIDCDGFQTQGFIENSPCAPDPDEPEARYYLAPEYTPTQAVVMSEQLLDYPEGVQLVQAVAQAGAAPWLLSAQPAQIAWASSLLGDKAKLLDVPTDTLWARDWAPLFAVPAKAEARAELKLLDTNYYSGRSLDDMVPQQLRSVLTHPDFALKVERASLPVYMEGGNITCTRAHCYVTDEIVLQNSARGYADDIALDETGIRNAFATQLDQSLHFVEQIPFESTKHIDVWAKFLDENTLLISELSDETLATLPESQRRHYMQVQRFLERQATGVGRAGQTLATSLGQLAKQHNPKLNIIRIPMPAPGYYGGSQVFRTYTNSLLINGVALVPRYHKVGFSGEAYLDEALMPTYEKEVERIYQAAGYQVVWLDFDTFIRLQGAVHCVTMQVPAT